jgi:hypothetical protein
MSSIVSISFGVLSYPSGNSGKLTRNVEQHSAICQFLVVVSQ